MNGEGMPHYHDAGSPAHQDSGEEYGKLYVEYTVVLPDQMETGMEKDFHALFEKWRGKKAVELDKDAGRPVANPTNVRKVRDEL